MRALFLLSVLALATGQTFGQGTMHRPTAETETRDSEGHLKLGGTRGTHLVRGSVTLDDGAAPKELVTLYAECGGARIFAGIADSKGAFSFSPDSSAAASKGKSCAVRAFLEGYRSAAKPLIVVDATSDIKVGKLVLQPLAATANGLFSRADEQADKAQKEYDKALNQAANGDWQSAMISLRKATARYADYSSAWLTLGILESQRGERAEARKSLLEAIRADAAFALPLIQLASLEAAQGDWQGVLDHSQKAIDLNPAAFPSAYALNAMAHVSLQQVDAAEKSAREGLRLDTGHEYAELQFSLGVVLLSKGVVEEGTKHLQTYLELAPNGPNAGAARTELAVAAKPANADITPTEAASTARPEPRELPAGAGPALAALQQQNAPLLEKTPSHTCLESISRWQVDTRGKAHDAELIRVDVGIAEDKEIYGYVEGKRFSNDGLAQMLGYTFSTTGLFGSVARGLIAGNAAKVRFAGEEVLNGQSVFRYDFRSSPGEAGWSLRHGKESGQAAEEGWFLVDHANLVLRRVVLHAFQIPLNLKLKAVDAVIDYAPETIADRRVLLPQTAQVHVKESSGTERLSHMFFNHCRAFAAESTVSFGEEPAPAEDRTQAGKTGLPADLEVIVSLRSAIGSASGLASDVLTAGVAEPVIVRGRELIAPGANVEGHVFLDKGANTLLIELDRVQTHHGWEPFYARLVSVSGAQIEKSASGELAQPDIPGAAKIVLTGGLAAGTRMVWKTELLAAPKDAGTPQLGTSMEMR
jgi:tetratricopeptide (TPR) repeat protein